MKTKWKIAALIVVLLLSIGMVSGWNLRKATFKCPVIEPDTVRIFDTVYHVIPSNVPYYITKLDTIVLQDTITVPTLLTKEDTLNILKDYYALHVYDRSWKNDTLEVYLKDTLSRNISIGSNLTYKINTPFTIVNNDFTNVNTNKITNVNYTKYLTVGVSVPFTFVNKDFTFVNYVSFDANYNGVEGMLVCFNTKFQ
jgi:hypothetical protein